LWLNDYKHDFHPLTLAGYALLLVVVYANLEDDRLHLEREFFVTGDELRMEFVEVRDKKQPMVADELDPGPCEGCEEWCAR
jgi:CRISPR-associated protein Csa1